MLAEAGRLARCIGEVDAIAEHRPCPASALSADLQAQVENTEERVERRAVPEKEPHRAAWVFALFGFDPVSVRVRKGCLHEDAVDLLQLKSQVVDLMARIVKIAFEL